MLSSCPSILAEARSIISTPLQQRQSISFNSFFQCPNFRSSRPELFCKKLPETCKFIKKETLAQVIPCEFCEIFKNIFFHKTPPVDASDISTNQK